MLLENLTAIARRVPGTSGLKTTDGLLSYAALAERAARLATGFSKRGIGPGDAVAVLLPNGPELFAVAYALFGLGAIVMPLNIAAPAPELTAATRRASARAIIARPAQAAVAAEVAANTTTDGTIPVILSGADGLDLLARSQPTTLAAPSADAPALYLFSSGSTGRPKIVPHTHGEMLANGRATAADFALTSDDVVFNNLPGNHAMGFLNSVFEVPEAGATTFYFSDPTSILISRDRLLEAIERERVSILPGVPFMFDVLAGAGEGVRLDGVRLTYSAGVSLKRPTFDRFRERFGMPLRQAYGCTEAGHVAFNRVVDPEPSWDSVGRPVGDTRVEVVPVENPFGADHGELVFHSSSLTKGYLNEPATNEMSFRNGLFSTGDLGKLDAEGNIYIRGRSKLIVEVAGHKIDPLEVEDVLAQHPDVAEAVVVGVPSRRTGEQELKAVVVRDGDVTPEALIRFCKTRLAIQKVPSIVEFIDAIPRSATGKILRGRLM